MHSIDLDGTWTMSERSGEHRCPAQVPGTCHGALLAAGLIEDPYHQRNEDELQWIGERAWRWEREVELDADQIAERRIELVCEGLDTFATVRVNDREVARAENMHRVWRFEVGSTLRPGRNRLVIDFDSVMPFIRRRQAEHPLNSPRCIAHEPAGRSHVRKEHSNFGWDWGPVLITNGIYRSLRLECFSHPRLERPQIRQRHGRSRVTLDVQARCRGRGAGLRGRITVRRGRRTLAEREVALRGGELATSLAIADPELWWPNGLGSQPLHDVTVELLQAEERIDRHDLRIGLRTIELRRKDDRWGQSFVFVVNKRTIFAKGACWIPADAIKDRADTATYRRLLGDAAAANMNMVRVWGGGYFERDAFYQTCDELGLLVWHDFMFACSAYPGDDPVFRKNVRLEVRDQVRRLRHHASIALWCGNNELEMFVTKKNADWPRMPFKWYRKIFDVEIPKVLATEDPDRDYWPCSPHSPIGDRDDHNNPDCGNAHLWNVWHGKQPFEWYRTSFHRFCTEFGFQSFPEPKTVAGYTEPEDRYLNSPVMEWHQRSGIGNTTIMHYLMSWFPMPHGFDATLLMSQLVQAMAITYAVEHWRRHMPRCMGAVYWQLNDNWPVASWASIDFPGNWKALHYAAKRFFAPLLLSALEDEARGRIDLHLSNDHDTPDTTMMHWRLVTTAGDTVAEGSERCAVPSNGARRALRVDCREAIAEHGVERLLLFAEARRGRTVLARTWSAFRKPKALDLYDPRLRSRARVDGERVRVSLVAARPALFVTASHDRHQFVADDNVVMLGPGEERELVLTPRGCNARQLARGLQVHSLTDLIESAVLRR